MKWIEFQFSDNMNWNNYGKYWHIDHVIPMASFNFSKEEDVKFCMNWKNLRPLEAKLNISKGCKVDENLYKYQLVKAEIFKMVMKTQHLQIAGNS